MFHFQGAFQLRINSSNQMEIKPKKPQTITDSEIEYLEEILSGSQALSGVTLDLRYCQQVTDKGLFKIHNSLRQLKELKTLTLNLTECTKITDIGLSEIINCSVKGSSTLTELTLLLEGCSGLSSKVMITLLEAIQTVQSLLNLEIAFPGITESTMSALKQSLFKLENLKSLHLHFGSHNTKDGTILEAGFTQLAWAISKLTELEQLKLDFYRGNWEISDSGVSQLRDALIILTKLKTLHLNLRGLENLTQTSVAYLNEALIKLKGLEKLHLNLKSGKESGSVQLKVPLSELENLTSLHLDFSWIISDDGISELSKPLGKLKNLTYLSLNFSGCKNVTDNGLLSLKEAIRNLEKLTYVNLEFPWCERITDTGLQYLSEGIEPITSLAHFALNLERTTSENDEVTDLGLKHLSVSLIKMVNMKTLNLSFSSSSKITDKGISDLAEAIKKMTKLESLTLDLHLCENLSDLGATALMCPLKDLKKLDRVILNFVWCDKMTEKNLKALKEEVKKVRNLSEFLVTFQRHNTNVEEETCNIF